MTLYVSISPDCKSDAKRHNCESALFEIKERVEAVQRIYGMTPFAGSFWVKKKFAKTRQLRLIGQLTTVHNQEVLILLRIMIRGDNEYELFCRLNSGARDELLENFFHNFQAQMEDEILQRISDQPVDALPRPSEAESEYLFNIAHSDTNWDGDTVFESVDWIEHVQQEVIHTHLAFIPDAIMSLVDDATQAESGWYSIADTNLMILYRYQKSEANLFLAGVIEVDSDIEKEKLTKRYQPLLGDQPIDHETISKNARRSYPAILLTDRSYWLAIQNDRESNLALSPEESDLLRSVGESRGRKRAFPLFINGRAGSGKSTILQYMFIDYLIHYLQNREILKSVPAPVYFTCSSNLLDVAKNTVSNLIEKRSDLLMARDKKSLTREEIRLIDGSFKKFYDYLKSLLPTAIQRQFSPNNYVDWVRFRKLWNEKFSFDQSSIGLTPEESWHVIRSVIKGANLEDDSDITPIEYQGLPKAEKIICFEQFDRIYQKIWMNWYRREGLDGRLWDDQDLVRAVIDHIDDLDNEEKPLLSAIFCDEAQDFTRNELELIFRLSLFSHRTVHYDEIGAVPFVFAGDEFQTLNPTGFRWEAIKAIFTEKIILPYSGDGAGKRDINYEELSYNYRSEPNIVRLSNLLQLIRSVLFNIKNIKSQTPWSVEENSPSPLLFHAGDSGLVARLRQEKDIVFLAPCGYNEEKHFRDTDRWLASVIDVIEGVPVNLYSAVRAKGLEFNRVALYGFGANAPEVLKRKISDGLEPFPSREGAALEAEYFINRLYVALTRAKKRLMIIEPEEGMDFWLPFQQPNTIPGLYSDNANEAMIAWRKCITSLVEGSEESDISQCREENYRDQADERKMDGMTRRDPYQLRQAAALYRNMGDSNQADSVLAWAELFEGKYLESGNRFVKIEDYSHALPVLWLAGKEGWHRVDWLSDSSKMVAKHVINRILKQVEIQQAGDPLSAVALLSEISKKSESWVEKLKLTDMRIHEENANRLVNRLLSKLDISHQNPAEEGVKTAEWTSLQSTLSKIANTGITISAMDLGRVSCLAGDYRESIRIFEHENLSGSNRFYDFAKAKVAPFPENLFYLQRLNCHEEITLQVLEQPDHAGLTRSIIDQVVVSLCENNELQSSLEVVFQRNNPNTLASLKKILPKLPQSLQPLYWAVAIQLIVTAGQFDRAFVLARGEPAKMIGPKRRKIKRPLEQLLKAVRKGVGVVLIKILARSDSLVSARMDDQKSVRAYLNKRWKQGVRKLPNCVSALEMVAAVERAGRFSDALQLCESFIEDDTLNPADQKALALRWLRVKDRQIRHDEERERPVVDSIRRLEEKKKQLKIKSLDIIPDYPELPKLTLDDLSLCFKGFTLPSITQTVHDQDAVQKKQNNDVLKSTKDQMVASMRSNDFNILNLVPKSGKETDVIGPASSSLALAGASGISGLNSLDDVVSQGIERPDSDALKKREITDQPNNKASSAINGRDTEHNQATIKQIEKAPIADSGTVDHENSVQKREEIKEPEVTPEPEITPEPADSDDITQSDQALSTESETAQQWRSSSVVSRDFSRYMEGYTFSWRARLKHLLIEERENGGLARVKWREKRVDSLDHVVNKVDKHHFVIEDWSMMVSFGNDRKRLEVHFLDKGMYWGIQVE
ncbi:MAG: hypothetical protein HQL54_02600 [Magnetococcales bacterium]|nr:hypothetical protein [Magnetococcales bacterium]